MSSHLGVLDKTIVVFQIGNQNFALSLDNVKEIIKVPVITPVPLTKSYLAGLINLRGEIVPVLNLKEKYKIESFINDDARIIIIEKDSKKSGLLVDKVLNINQIEDAQLNDCRVATLDEIKAVIKQKDQEKLITLIDSNKILEESYELKLLQKMNKILDASKMYAEQKQTITEERFILISISNQNYALNITDIQEIIRYTELSTLPSHSDDIMGIINLRNEVIPVVNIQKHLKIKQISEISEETKIIIVNLSNLKIGFIVDKVFSVVSLDANEIKKLPTIANYESFFRGTIKVDEKIYIILNIQELVKKVHDSISDEFKTDKEVIEMSKSNIEQQVVLFDINQQRFTIDIQKIKEINRIPNIVKVPHEKGYIKGIANLRGEVIVIIDLGVMFYNQETELNDSSRVIIIELNGDKFGILARKVLSVSKVNKEDIVVVEDSEDEEIKEKLKDVDIKYIKAVIKQGGLSRILCFQFIT